MPVITTVFSWLNIRPLAPDQPWTYGLLGLLGLGCFLIAIIRLLDDVRADLRAMTFVLDQVLKDPDEEEAVISLATYQHLRRRLGLD
jgi:hypothetical protein